MYLVAAYIACYHVPWCKGLYFCEGDNGISCGLYNVCVCKGLVPERSYCVSLSLSIRDVEPHLHQGDRGGLVLVKFQCYFILPSYDLILSVRVCVWVCVYDKYTLPLPLLYTHSHTRPSTHPT